MGLFNHLYPEQNHILNHWHQVKSIAYKDDNVALETIFYSVLKSCSLGEKSIVVIPDSKLRNAFSALIKDYQLSPITLEYDPDSSVTKDDVSILQSKLNTLKIQDNESQYTETLHHCQQSERVITSILHSFHAHDGDRNMQSVLDRMRDIATFDHKDMIQTIQSDIVPELDETGFDDFYDTIMKASRLYHPTYIHEQKKRKFNVAEHHLLDETSIQNLLNSLKKYISDLQSLRDRYYFFINITTKRSLKELNDQIVQALQAMNKLKFIARTMVDKTNVSSTQNILKIFGFKSSDSDNMEKQLSEAYQKLIVQLEVLPDFTYKFIDLKETRKNPENVVKSIINIEEDLQTWYKSRKSKLRSSFKYSNIFNQKEKNTLSELEEELFSLFNKFNEENIFEHTFEINTLSLQKQTEILNNVILECEFVYNDILENKGYYAWDSFVRTQDLQVKNSIKWLQNFPADVWNHIVEYCYLYRWIEVKLPPEYESLSEWVETFRNSVQSLPAAWINNQTVQQVETRETKIKNFANLHKMLWKSIQQNKGVEKLHWRYFFEKNGAFWSTFFPIVITPKDLFEDMESGNYTNLFYLNAHEINPETLHLGKTIHSYYPTENNTRITCDIALSHELFIPSSGLKGSQGIEKLQNARAIANNFYCIQKNFALFQTKNANIISCLNDSINTQLLSHFYHSGIKEILPGDAPVERLIECLIESERKPCLLLHDYFIRPEDTESLFIQLKITNDFAKFGFQICTLQTRDLMEDFDSAVYQFCTSVQ